MKCYYFVFVAKGAGSTNPSAQDSYNPAFTNLDAWKETLLSKYPVSGETEMIIVNDSEWVHPEVGTLNIEQPIQTKAFLDAIYHYLTKNLGYYKEQAVQMLNATHKNKLIDTDYSGGFLRFGVPFEWEDEETSVETTPDPVPVSEPIPEPIPAPTPEPIKTVDSGTFCRECGFNLPPNSKFCPDCGSKLGIEPPVDIPPAPVPAKAAEPIPVPVPTPVIDAAPIVTEAPTDTPPATTGTGIPSLFGLKCPDCGSGIYQAIGEKGSVSKSVGSALAFGAIGALAASSSAQKNMGTNPIEYQCASCKKKFVTLPLEANPEEFLPSPCTIHFQRISSALGAAIAHIVYLNGMKIGPVKNGKELTFTTPLRYNTIFVTDPHGVAFKDMYRFEATPNGSVLVQFNRKFK